MTHPHPHPYRTIRHIDHHLRRAVADGGGRLLHYLAATTACGRLDVVVEFLVPPTEPDRVAERLGRGLRAGADRLPLRPAVHVVPAGAFHQWWAAREDGADDDAPAGPAGVVADPALLADLRRQSADGWREYVE